MEIVIYFGFLHITVDQKRLLRHGKQQFINCCSNLRAVACFLPTSVNSAVSYQIARVSVKPSTNEVRIGDNFTIDVNATDVDDFYSFEFKLSYDTRFLDGLNVTVTPPWPLPSGSEIVDSEGYVWINCSLTEPPGIAGDVALASIVFEATAGGNTTLYLYVIDFSNSTGGPIPLIVNDGFITVWPWNLHIPEDYPTIQEGINAANPGDIIFVSSDTYYEHVIVNKTVSLMGEGKETTIIDGNGTGTVAPWSPLMPRLRGLQYRMRGIAVYLCGIVLIT